MDEAYHDGIRVNCTYVQGGIIRDTCAPTIDSYTRLPLACRKRGNFYSKSTSVRSDFSFESGIDRTVRGLARLKKAAGIAEEIYGDIQRAVQGQEGIHLALRLIHALSREVTRDKSRLGDSADGY